MRSETLDSYSCPSMWELISYVLIIYQLTPLTNSNVSIEGAKLQCKFILLFSAYLFELSLFSLKQQHKLKVSKVLYSNSLPKPNSTLTLCSLTIESKQNTPLIAQYKINSVNNIYTQCQHSKNKTRMGNDYNLCKHSNTQQTTFAHGTIEHLQPVPLIQSYHKTLEQFLNDNHKFFANDGMPIMHLLLSQNNIEEQINKFPIERITENEKIFLPNLTKEEFPVYKGECLILDFKNLELYLGQVDCEKKSGYGVLVNSQGNKFQGQWAHDFQNGQGILTILYPKRVYKGQWKNGKVQGFGSAVYQDGARYQGNFLQGKKHGMGVLKFFDGALYEGSFCQDLMHGYGTLTTSKGREIGGQWKQGKYQIVRPQRSSKTFSINQLPVL